MNVIVAPTILDFFMAYLFVFAACLLWEKYIRRTLSYQRGVFLSLLVGYVLIAFLLAVQPTTASGEAPVNLQPFRSIVAFMQSSQGHWLLMWQTFLPMPFVFFVGFIARGRLGFFRLFGIGFAASLLTAWLLFLMNGISCFPRHFFDVDMLILNGLGVCLGSVLFCGLSTRQWMKDCISETMSTK